MFTGQGELLVWLIQNSNGVIAWVSVEIQPLLKLRRICHDTYAISPAPNTYQGENPFRPQNGNIFVFTHTSEDESGLQVLFLRIAEHLEQALQAPDMASLSGCQHW